MDFWLILGTTFILIIIGFLTLASWGLNFYGNDDDDDEHEDYNDRSG